MRCHYKGLVSRTSQPSRRGLLTETLAHLAGYVGISLARRAFAMYVRSRLLVVCVYIRLTRKKSTHLVSALATLARRITIVIVH